MRGGAVGIRAQGLDDIAAIRAAVDLPLIGLWKDGDDDVFITPTLEHALAVARAGAHVVAIDGTSRPRPDGLTLAETIKRHPRRDRAPSSWPTARPSTRAWPRRRAGADLVGTTLAGYTAYTSKGDGPDLDLVARLAAALDVPVIAEGRIHTPAQAAAAIGAGAWAVVVGTAITHPTTITELVRGCRRTRADRGARPMTTAASPRRSSSPASLMAAEIAEQPAVFDRILLESPSAMWPQWQPRSATPHRDSS